MYDEVRATDISVIRKLDNRWLGPYFVRDISPKGAYILATADGVILAGTYPGRRLKRFEKVDGF